MFLFKIRNHGKKHYYTTLLYIIIAGKKFRITKKVSSYPNLKLASLKYRHKIMQALLFFFFNYYNANLGKTFRTSKLNI